MKHIILLWSAMLTLCLIPVALVAGLYFNNAIVAISGSLLILAAAFYLFSIGEESYLSEYRGEL